jgi:hypothetical protein
VAPEPPPPLHAAQALPRGRKRRYSHGGGGAVAGDLDPSDLGSVARMLLELQGDSFGYLG